MIDTHVHTAKFSTDSVLKIEELLEVLEGRHFKDGICICEHMDFGAYVTDDKKFDVETYFKEYQQYRGKIKLGIEIGMDLLYDEINTYNEMDFDYMIGSIHGYKGENLYNNPGLYPKDKNRFYRDYFEYAIICLKKFSFVDAFAHFDYISRYAPYENPVLEYETFKNEYIKLFHVLIENNIILEVNTKHIADLDNLKYVLQGYHQCGGECVTLGSDAHSKSAVFYKFDQMISMIKEIGLEIVYFEHRKMRMEEI